MVSLESESLIGLVAVGTLPAVALAGMFVSSTAAGAVAIVGWLLLVPMLGILADDEEFSFGEEASDAAESESSDPLDELRSRYAAGELTDAEFERRLERLLETEGIDVPPEASVESSTPAERRASAREAETER